MSDTIGKDGLTDEERRPLPGTSPNCACFACTARKFRDTLAAERLTHAETRAERDRLRAALEATRVAGDRLHDDLILYHAAADAIPEWNRARALLGEVKP